MKTNDQLTKSHSLFISMSLFTWLCWTLIITATDIVSIAHSFYPDNYWLNLFNSQNFALVKSFWAHYHINNTIINVSSLSFMLALIIFNSFIFFKAFISSVSKKYNSWYTATCQAFYLLISIHLIFILLDEVFFQYPTEHGHLMRMGVITINFILIKMIYSEQTPQQ